MNQARFLGGGFRTYITNDVRNVRYWLPIFRQIPFVAGTAGAAAITAAAGVMYSHNRVMAAAPAVDYKAVEKVTSYMLEIDKRELYFYPFF